MEPHIFFKKDIIIFKFSRNLMIKKLITTPIIIIL